MQVNKAIRSKVREGVSYGRVSTDGQFLNADGARKDDASPEAQRKRCLDHIAYLSNINGKGIEYKIVEHISDEGFSGKNTKRPGFQQMWQLIEAGKINFIVATELSRLSRSVADFLELIEHCEKHNVDVFIIGLKLDTTEAFGRFVLVVLVAMAQFEREITSQRVKENALTRLLTDGKINGSSEILGLVRDSNRPGHFLIDEQGLVMAEKIMKLFLQFSSKKKVLDTAKQMGLTGQKGKELTLAAISNILENAKWRYRGLWYANEENKDVDPELLPESKRYQLVKLPHGSLLEETLLDQVVDKMKDTYDKKKRSGKDNYTYLLSNTLVYEDGSKFGGEPGKDRQYRYYHNKKHKIRIRCDELDPVIIKRVKSYLKEHELYKGLVEAAIRRRQTSLPKLETEIEATETALKEIDDTEAKLRERLFDKNHREQVDFMKWLEEQVNQVKRNREQKLRDLDALKRARQEIREQAGLEKLESTLKEFVEGFDELTRVQQRTFAERIIEKVIVKPGNKIDIKVYGEPPLGVRRKQSTDSELNGRADWI